MFLPFLLISIYFYFFLFLLFLSIFADNLFLSYEDRLQNVRFFSFDTAFIIL
jgi:hypothetical protein